jgi:integrase
MPKVGESRAAWSTRKKDNAPKGLFRTKRGGWGVRFTCGRGCIHQEPVGEKSKALRVYHQRRTRALSESGWCPKLERRAKEADGLTLEEYGEKWLLSRAKELKPRTLDHYDQVLRDHVYPALGSTPLRGLTRPMLKTWLGQVKRAGATTAKKEPAVLSRETLKNVIIPLRAMLNDALDDGLVLSNPAVRLLKRTRGLTEKDARKVEAYSREALTNILHTADARCPDWSEFFKVLSWCGLRLGEACGLQWGDVDAVGGFLTIYRTAQYRKVHGTVTLLLGAPKSGKGRKVDVPQALVDKLHVRRGIMEAEATLNGQEPSPWIFPSPSDATKPVDAAFIRYKRWYKVLRVAGLRSLKLHALRHTYASLLLQDGESPAYVKEQMGHSSIQVTVDRYGHFIPGKNRGAVERLAAATSQPVGQREPSELVSARSNFDVTKTAGAVNR